MAEGYFYVTDEAGDEIEGSRRYLADCKTVADLRRVWDDLQAKAGDGCVVRDSVEDREPEDDTDGASI